MGVTPCARGCCWTAFQICSRQRSCRCHADERKPGGQVGSARVHSDPTATQAIRNIMKENRTK